jgi:succinoglycan biosynthesis transport protein ExoP
VQLARDSELYYVLMNNVKTAALDAGYGSVTVEMLKEADIPAKERAKDFVWRPLRYGAIGIAIALVGMSLFPDAGLSRTHRIAGALGMPRLAEVPWTDDDPGSAKVDAAFSEAISGLCKKIRLASTARSAAGSAARSVARSTQRVVVTSGPVSQGTSTIAIAVATELARPDARVLLIDANMRRPSLHRLLRLDGRVGLSTVLSGRARLADVVIPLSGFTGVDVLTVGPVPPRSLHLAAVDAMGLLLEQADGLYAWVVLDTAPVETGAEVAKILDMADLALLVVRGGSPSHRTLVRTGNAVHDSEVPLAGFVQLL